MKPKCQIVFVHLPFARTIFALASRAASASAAIARWSCSGRRESLLNIWPKRHEWGKNKNRDLNTDTIWCFYLTLKETAASIGLFLFLLLVFKYHILSMRGRGHYAFYLGGKFLLPNSSLALSNIETRSKTDIYIMFNNNVLILIVTPNLQSILLSS